MFRPALLLAVVALSASTLGGCALSRAGGTSGRPTVVAAFYPLEYVARRIVGPHATVVSLAQPGVEPHDLQLTVRQTATVSAAEVGFYERGFQPAVDQVMADDSPDRVVDVASVVHLHAPAAGEGEGGPDPHFWQDPTLLARAADAFTRAIVRADPDHAATYRARNRSLQRDLTALDHDLRRGLAHCRTRTIVVSHDAFEYLARRYGLHVASIGGVSPESEASPAHLARLSALIRREHLTTVFREPLESPKLADAVARDLGVETAVLDPIEALTSADEDQDYLGLMRRNLVAIQKANACS